jgi:hypothetical protein
MFGVGWRAEPFVIDTSTFSRATSFVFKAQTSTACLPTCKQSEHLDRQFVELFLAQAPDERSKRFPSHEEAIAHHDLEFSDI